MKSIIDCFVDISTAKNISVWKKLFRVLRTIPGIHLRHERRVRRFGDAVLYGCRSGCQWRLWPWVYGKWRTVHARFKSLP